MEKDLEIRMVPYIPSKFGELRSTNGCDLCTLTHQAASFPGSVTTSRLKREFLRNETVIEKMDEKDSKHRTVHYILPKVSKLWPTLRSRRKL